jgi:predicted nucleic-acid-binding Zn-ribbon protein
MRHDLTCRKCGGGKLWNVRSVKESGEDLSVTLRKENGGPKTIRKSLLGLQVTVNEWTTGFVVGNGRFELLVCAACGYAEWFARDFATDVAGISAGSAPRPCPECAQSACWYVAEAMERDGFTVDRLRVLRKGFPKFWSEGSFSLRICQSCGRTDWIAREMAHVEPSPGHGLTRLYRDCPACKAPSILRVQRVKESAGELHLEHRKTLFNRERGGLALELCPACGDTTWLGVDLDDLVEDAKAGVALLERPPVPQGGPYR